MIILTPLCTLLHTLLSAANSSFYKVPFFKHFVSEAHHLLAVGSLYKVDPNRVVCKRIVLSGHPFKINKKSAVARYMFFNRGIRQCTVLSTSMYYFVLCKARGHVYSYLQIEDIQWFKPIELRTQHGRRGHIKEPLGQF